MGNEDICSRIYDQYADIQKEIERFFYHNPSQERLIDPDEIANDIIISCIETNNLCNLKKIPDIIKSKISEIYTIGYMTEGIYQENENKIYVDFSEQRAVGSQEDGESAFLRREYESIVLKSGCTKCGHKGRFFYGKRRRIYCPMCDTRITLTSVSYLKGTHIQLRYISDGISCIYKDASVKTADLAKLMHISQKSAVNFKQKIAFIVKTNPELSEEDLVHKIWTEKRLPFGQWRHSRLGKYYLDESVTVYNTVGHKMCGLSFENSKGYLVGSIFGSRTEREHNGRVRISNKRLCRWVDDTSYEIILPVGGRGYVLKWKDIVIGFFVRFDYLLHTLLSHSKESHNYSYGLAAKVERSLKNCVI